jgi:hypothetical protein|tara:strand:+ start:69 stop:203 length:135 start_codon:yes stop_codon:yes gene_type:complete
VTVTNKNKLINKTIKNLKRLKKVEKEKKKHQIVASKSIEDQFIK